MSDNEKTDKPPTKTYRVLVPMPQQVRDYFLALTDVADVKQVFEDSVVITVTTEEDEYELGRSMLALESTLWSLGGWEDTPKVSRPKEITE